MNRMSVLHSARPHQSHGLVTGQIQEMCISQVFLEKTARKQPATPVRSRNDLHRLRLPCRQVQDRLRQKPGFFTCRDTAAPARVLAQRPLARMRLAQLRETDRPNSNVTLGGPSRDENDGVSCGGPAATGLPLPRSDVSPKLGSQPDSRSRKPASGLRQAHVLPYCRLAGREEHPLAADFLNFRIRNLARSPSPR